MIECKEPSEALSDYTGKKGSNGLKKIRRAIAYLIYPISLVALAYLLNDNADAFPQQLQQTLMYLPYGLLAVAGLLSLSFNRSKIFFVALVLAFSYGLLVHYIPDGMDKVFYQLAVFKTLTILLPIDILVLSSLKERGIFSSWGRMRFMFIGAQLLMIAWIVWYQDADLVQLLRLDFFEAKYLFSETYSQFALALFLVSFCVLFARQVGKGMNSDSPLLAVLILLFSAFIVKDEPMAFSLHMAAAGLVLTAAMLRASYSMAYLDELTGLPSRRALKEDMLKLKGKYTVSMLDVDHFKKFNDTHGHDVGDEVLKMVASCLKNLKGNGKAYRYGGEEFTLIFPATELDEVAPILEELRITIAGRGFTKRSKSRPEKKPSEVRMGSGGNKRLSVTVSMGVAERGDKYKKADEVIKAADKALYRAKSKGRNCISK